MEVYYTHTGECSWRVTHVWMSSTTPIYFCWSPRSTRYPTVVPSSVAIHVCCPSAVGSEDDGSWSHRVPELLMLLLYLGGQESVDDKHEWLGIFTQINFLFTSLKRQIWEMKTYIELLDLFPRTTCLNSSQSNLAPSSLLLTSSGKFLLKTTDPVWPSFRVNPSS